MMATHCLSVCLSICTYIHYQIDPVKIGVIEEIGNPQEVGQRIVQLEQKKEGTIKVELRSASKTNNHLVVSK